jgi:hypothetical protein
VARVTARRFFIAQDRDRSRLLPGRLVEFADGAAAQQRRQIRVGACCLWAGKDLAWRIVHAIVYDAPHGDVLAPALGWSGA